jgi:hypothetical protein
LESIILTVTPFRWGIATLTASIGTLIGTPIGGGLGDPATGYYVHAQAFAGTMMAVGAILYLWPLVVSVRYDDRAAKREA